MSVRTANETFKGAPLNHRELQVHDPQRYNRHACMLGTSGKDIPHIANALQLVS